MTHRFSVVYEQHTVSSVHNFIFNFIIYFIRVSELDVFILFPFVLMHPEDGDLLPKHVAAFVCIDDQF